MLRVQGAGSKFASDCSRVLPGYGIQTLDSVSSADQVPALPAGASGLPEATLCGIGYYSAGGYCIRCPYGAVTRNLGAKAVEECGEYCRRGGIPLRRLRVVAGTVALVPPSWSWQSLP